MPDTMETAARLVREWFSENRSTIAHASVFPGSVISDANAPPGVLIVEKRHDVRDPDVRSALLVALCDAFERECEVVSMLEDAPERYRSSRWFTDIGRAAIHVGGRPIEEFVPTLR